MWVGVPVARRHAGFAWAAQRWLCRAPGRRPGVNPPESWLLHLRGSVHKAYGLFAHITWHSWRRQQVIRRDDVLVINEVIREAGVCRGVHVHAQAVLSDHVHVLVSYNPATCLASFIRHAKSESARCLNRQRVCGPEFRRCRGYYAGSISRSHLGRVREYLGRQHARHPQRIPV